MALSNDVIDFRLWMEVPTVLIASLWKNATRKVGFEVWFWKPGCIEMGFDQV